tara:strand:+ start:1054 stop:1725 length:672 start_codon:yes stop_codon:yes gene_type:complete
MRIQKFLSQQNMCSRRQAEVFIEKGWIYINDKKVSKKGQLMDPEKDSVRLADEAKEVLKKRTYIKYYKPRGIITHSPGSNEESIQDIIDPAYKHCFPIGRLDKDSEGLILLTDDGVFAKQCLTNDNPHQRDYIINVSKSLTTEMIRKCERGMIILGKKTKPCKLKKISNKLYQITLFEGKNRQIRRMIQKVGSHVTALKRIRFGPILLNNLTPNQIQIIHPFS